jgi:hypothetical protein
MNNIQKAIEHFNTLAEISSDACRKEYELAIAALREVKAWRSGKWEYESIDINGPLDVKLAELFKEQE